MREIKFRAWHGGHKYEKPQMLYDDKPGDCLVFLNQGQNIKAIMQYTGLKDKNGQEIYEGDILQFTMPENLGGGTFRTGPVRWREEFSYFGADISLTEIVPEDAWVKECEYEIVGNVAYEFAGEEAGTDDHKGS